MTETSSKRTQSPSRLAWRAFLKNRSAVTGMSIVVVFFLLALVGLSLTRGDHPVLNPREVRLPDKLKPPLATPDREAVPAPSLHGGASVKVGRARLVGSQESAPPSVA